MYTAYRHKTERRKHSLMREVFMREFLTMESTTSLESNISVAGIPEMSLPWSISTFGWRLEVGRS